MSCWKQKTCKSNTFFIINLERPSTNYCEICHDGDNDDVMFQLIAISDMCATVLFIICHVVSTIRVGNLLSNPPIVPDVWVHESTHEITLRYFCLWLCFKSQSPVVLVLQLIMIADLCATTAFVVSHVVSTIKLDIGKETERKWIDDWWAV